MEKVWNIASDDDFQRVALETFRFQARNTAPYRDYLALVGCDVDRVESIEQIPFLPIELFKSHEVYCGESAPEAVFTSSGALSSRHYVKSLSIYEEAFTRGFEWAYGDPHRWGIYALLPSYLEREGSSLIYMFDRLIALSKEGSDSLGGGFYLYDHKRLIEDIARDDRPKLLLGVSYALLDLAESGLVGDELKGCIVMETGGMKGRREEISKGELHRVLCNAFGVDKIHSEYGMAELLSQGYSRGDGVFETPAWMRIYIRDLSDPFDVSPYNSQGRGGVNVVDLASRYSCSFIETQDLGRSFGDGRFMLEGRISGSDIRGCNLLIE